MVALRRAGGDVFIQPALRVVFTVICLAFNSPSVGAEDQPNHTPPSNRAEIKELLTTALFSPTWRWPVAASLVVLLNKTTVVAMYLPPGPEREQYEPVSQRLADTLARLQKDIGFPRIAPNQKLVTDDKIFSGRKGDDPYVRFYALPPDEFANSMNFYSRTYGGGMVDVERYLNRGCFFPLGSAKKGIKGSTIGYVRSDLPDAQFDKCVADILYLAHGIWAEDAPHKDIVLKIMYDPMVRPGMTREALFELVDQGVFDHLLAK